MWTGKRLSIAAIVFMVVAPATFVAYQGLQTLRILTVVSVSATTGSARLTSCEPLH